ncbi:MAG: DUF1553 domain-containing protein, partial [Candidatus Saccharimonas sp.]|nr:DUF1553 domain-containing protein [Planctomycetaceae bacterium]
AGLPSEQARREEAEKKRRPAVGGPAGSGDPRRTEVGFHYRDDFSQQRPDDWQPLSGQWVYENNRLVEKAVTSFATMVLKKATLPQDVRIKLRYRPLAAAGLRSIGFSFDYIDQGHSQDIYTHTGDASQSVQAFHRTGGQQVYPQAGIVQTKDLKVGEEATIEITARGQQLTIMLNGTKRLDYVMPVARREGKFALWVHQGSAEFLELEIRELTLSPEDLRREHRVAVDQVALAEKRLATAHAEVESLRARIAAERAKHGATQGLSDVVIEKRKLLILTASRAEKAVAVAKADEAVLHAEQNLMLVRPSLRAESAHGANATPVPSPPSSGERARVRGPNGDDASQSQSTEERTPHPNPLPFKARGEGTGEDTAADALLYDNSPAAIDAEQKLSAAKAALAAARSAREKPDDKYAAVGEMFPATSTGRRAALAQWIASKQNPRTARVAVNHIWLRHFGQALVPSVANFGLNGDQPSHPELLDWLAVELMENGWRMKPIHRAIVLSATYRMSSSGGGHGDKETRGRGENSNSSLPLSPAPLVPLSSSAAGTAHDPTNRYLWRMNSRRMEAEVVRDSVLFAAGSLDATRGGAEIPEAQGQTSLRRSLYFRNTPNEKMKFLELFDVADPNGCYRRKESVVPQQALALMNSALALDQSRLLAEKLTKQVGDKDDEPTNTAFITAAFETILSQSPTEAELAASHRFLQDHTKLVAASNQAVFTAGGQSQRGPSAVPAQRARENLVHVLFSHNAFVTVR